MHATKSQIETIDRLKRRSDFLRVQAAGRKWVSTTLILQVADRAGDKPAYGLTVSKKTDKRAVARNRIRRRLRAAAMDLLPAASPAMDYVLVGRPPGATCDYADITRDLRWCLKRMELLKP